MSKQLFRRLLPAASALVVAATYVVAAPGIASAASTCTDWTPVLSSYTVNQGLGAYSPLVQGKTTLLRLFLTEPSCALPGAEQLIRGTVTASVGSTVVGTASTSPATLGPTYPSLDAAATGATNDSPADPIFQLPALASTSAAVTDFPITFTVQLTYQYQDVTGTKQTTANYPAAGSTITAMFAPKPHPLRVLLVPMGDASATYASQFPTAANKGTPINGEYADQVVQNGMTTLSRLLPVSDGLADLTATTSPAGIRYTLDSQGMIDLGPNGLKQMNWATGQKFCSNAANFSDAIPNVSSSTLATVAGQLSAHLSTWNSNNKSAPADRVIGVVWQGISQGVTPNGCDEGRALINGNAAFVRLFADNTVTTTNALGSTSTSPNPSMTGALLGMETTHTWGGVPNSDSRAATLQDNHSKNISADPSNTQRGYNTSLAKWIASPLSDMHYSGDSRGYENPSSGIASGWDDTTALMEAPDYLYTQCALTSGMAAGDCPAGVATGGLASAKAGGSIVLSGTTNGTQSGTQIHSYFASVEQTPADPNSQYYLALTGPTGARYEQVPVGLNESEHNGAATTIDTSPIGVINAAMDAGDATSFALWHGQPPAGSPTCTPQNITQLPSCVYARVLQDPPIITSYTSATTLQNLNDFTPALGDDAPSALSPNGQYVAWVSGGNIRVQRRDPATNKPAGVASATLAGTDPAWSPDGTTLAYVTSAGDIDTVAVSTSGAQPTFSGSQVVYNHLLQTPPPLGSTSASHPTWSPDSGSFVAAVNGDLWEFASSSSANPIVCDLATLNVTTSCKPVATDADDAAPAWGSSGGTSAGGLVAYTHSGAIWTLDPNAAGFAPTARVPGASAPTWGGGQIAFVKNGNVVLANATIEDGSHGWPNQTTLTTSGQDSLPSLNANATAVALTHQTGGANGQDVFVGTIVQDQSKPLQFTAATTGDPKQLEADLYITCSGSNFPILVAVKSTGTQMGAYTSNGVTYNTANFSATYDVNRACAGGTIWVLVTDGFLQSQPTLIRTVPDTTAGGGGSQPRLPSPAIGAPRPGSIYLQYDAVLVVGSTIDASNTTNAGDVQTCWFLTGPAGSSYSNTPVGTCNANTEIDPPVNGWTPGGYTLTEKVTDSNGTASASVTYKVLPDPNHLGANVTVNFDPNTLYVPSSGNDVTLTVKSQSTDLKVIDPKTVRLSSIGGFPTSIPVDSASGTTGWVRNSDGTYSAKFNRQTVTCFINQHGQVGMYVAIVLSASGNGVTIQGYDPQKPITSPSTSTVAC